MRKLALAAAVLAVAIGTAFLVEHLVERSREAEIRRLSDLLDADLAALGAEVDERARLPGRAPRETAFELYRESLHELARLRGPEGGPLPHHIELVFRAVRAERRGDRSFLWENWSEVVLFEDVGDLLAMRALEIESGDPAGSMLLALALRLVAEDLRRGGSGIGRDVADRMRRIALPIIRRTAANGISDDIRNAAVRVLTDLLAKPETLRDARRGELLLHQLSYRLVLRGDRSYSVSQPPPRGLVARLFAWVRKDEISRGEIVEAWREVRAIGETFDAAPDHVPAPEVDNPLVGDVLADLRRKAVAFRTDEQALLAEERAILDELRR